MERLGGWLRAPAGVGLSFAVLLGMAALGMRLPGFDRLGPFGRPATLDYSAPPYGRIPPLRSPFVRSVLGPQTLDMPAAPGPGTGRGSGSTVPPATSIEHALTNDDYQTAFDASQAPFTARSDTTDAGRQRDEPTDCARFGGTVWYRYHANEDAGVVATTAAGFPVSLAAYRAPVKQGSRALACDSDAQGSARIAIPTFAGTTYLFQITQQVRGGRLVFSLDHQPSTAPVSVLPNGEYAGNAYDWGYPEVSANGRFVAFTSRSTRLDTRCAKGCGAQVYIRDLLTGVTELTSVTSAGGVPNLESTSPAISADGRFVAWHTAADNVTEDPDAHEPLTDAVEADVFIRDRLLGRTERVTMQRDGTEANGFEPSLSADGRYVAFHGDFERRKNPTTGWPLTLDVYVKDRATGDIVPVSIGINGERGNHDSLIGKISPDGRYVAFWSRATNLLGGRRVADGALNRAGFYHGRVYTFDRITWRLTLECVSEDGAPANDYCGGHNISRDGRYSVFWSLATNLVPGLRRIPTGPSQVMNLFVRDRATGRLEVVNITDDGTRIGEVWPRCCALGEPPKRFLHPDISWDGSIVGFETDASLAAGDDNGITDAYVRDRTRARTIRVSESSAGEPGNGVSEWTTISGDGSVACFVSVADNLAPGDTNQASDVFARLWRI